MFCAMLGTVAGNLALTLGARGGIYIAGGIVPRLGEAFAHSQFRARFEDKGRLRSYLAASRPMSSSGPTPPCSAPHSFSPTEPMPRSRPAPHRRHR